MQRQNVPRAVAAKRRGSKRIFESKKWSGPRVYSSGSDQPPKTTEVHNHHTQQDTQRDKAL
jgi:hypothetical protein